MRVFCFSSNCFVFYLFMSLYTIIITKILLCSLPVGSVSKPFTAVASDQLLVVILSVVHAGKVCYICYFFKT